MNDNYDNDIAPLPKADDASYSEAVMETSANLMSKQMAESLKKINDRANTPILTVDELIQAMRNSGSLADVRKRLEKLRQKDPASYNAICRFYGK